MLHKYLKQFSLCPDCLWPRLRSHRFFFYFSLLSYSSLHTLPTSVSIHSFKTASKALVREWTRYCNSKISWWEGEYGWMWSGFFGCHRRITLYAAHCDSQPAQSFERLIRTGNFGYTLCLLSTLSERGLNLNDVPQSAFHSSRRFETLFVSIICIDEGDHKFH